MPIAIASIRSGLGRLGFSAGAHLALLLGLTEPKDGFEGDGGHPEQSSKVQAVVNMMGPTDLSRSAWPSQTDRLITDLLGGSREQIPSVYWAASPLAYVHRGGPPVLTMHGTKDPIVPFEQAQLLHASLRRAHATSRLEPVKDKGHGEDWSREELLAAWDLSASSWTSISSTPDGALSRTGHRACQVASGNRPLASRKTLAHKHLASSLPVGHWFTKSRRVLWRAGLRYAPVIAHWALTQPRSPGNHFSDTAEILLALPVPHLPLHLETTGTCSHPSHWLHLAGRGQIDKEDITRSGIAGHRSVWMPGSHPVPKVASKLPSAM